MILTKFLADTRWIKIFIGAFLATLLLYAFARLWVLAERNASRIDVAIRGNGTIIMPLFPRFDVQSYFAKMSINNVDTVLLLDTGSDHMWVKHEFVPSFQESNQLTKPDFHMQYFGGNVTGFRKPVNVSMGGMAWTQKIGVGMQTSKEMQSIDGIVGLSRECRNDKTLCLHLQMGLKAMIFGFVVTDSVKMQGKFIAGEYDKKYCAKNQEIQWLPNQWITGSWGFFWTTKIDIQLGYNFVGSNKYAIWDTGTSAIYLSSELYRIVMDLLNHRTVYSCTTALLPPLTFKLGNKKYSLPARTYAQETRDNKCRYLISELTSNWNFQADVIIGWVFLHEHYVVFDGEDDRIGICPVQQRNYFFLV